METQRGQHDTPSAGETRLCTVRRFVLRAFLRHRRADLRHAPKPRAGPSVCRHCRTYHAIDIPHALLNTALQFHEQLICYGPFGRVVAPCACLKDERMGDPGLVIVELPTCNGSNHKDAEECLLIRQRWQKT